jgi:hypothetical protein
MYNPDLLKPLPNDSYVHCTTKEQLLFLYEYMPYMGQALPRDMWEAYGNNLAIGNDTYCNAYGVNKATVIPFSKVYKLIRLKEIK